ncbi:auxin-induced protein 6B-like [Nymphaea colorata]|nr:auxin-induced protein 6B-like [Nymphaea colorata]
MLSQTGRLPVRLRKWNLKPPAVVFRLPKFEPPPLSPKCVFPLEGAESGEEADANGGGHSSRVPKGCLAVYVGEGMRRFVIPLSYLNHSIFRALLKKAEEEFGFSTNGGIRLPCQPLLFEHILWLLENKDPIVQNLQLEEILELYHEVGDEWKSS